MTEKPPLQQMIEHCRSQQLNFGEILTDIMDKKQIEPKMLAYLILRNYRDTNLNGIYQRICKLMNNKLPRHLRMYDIEVIATALGCNEQEKSELEEALACHRLIEMYSKKVSEDE